MSAGTPRRSVRVEDELWNQAHAKAAREGTTVAERVRAALREYVHDSGTRHHTIEDSLVYLVPGSLEGLHGPSTGTVQLPIHLDWGPDRRYEAGDDASCRTLYQLTLQNSGSADEMANILNPDRLIALWPSMRLPARCRQLWNAAFPQLPTHSENKEHPAWMTLNEQLPK